MKINLLLASMMCFTLLGCSKEYKIEPTELPNAHVDKPYNQILKISGGKVSDGHFKVTTSYPEDMNLQILPVNDLDGYNLIKINGIPKYKGKYSIKIKAYFYGGGDKKIDKTYDFIVTD